MKKKKLRVPRWLTGIISALIVALPVLFSTSLALGTETTDGVTVSSLEATPTPTESVAPTATDAPAADPTADPVASADPTIAPDPTLAPSAEPTVAPDPTPAPSTEPTPEPTPSVEPTPDPTVAPEPNGGGSSDSGGGSSGGGGAASEEVQPKPTPKPWYVDPGRVTTMPVGDHRYWAIISGGQTVNVIVLEPDTAGGQSWIAWFNSPEGRAILGDNAVLAPRQDGDHTEPGYTTVIGTDPSQ